MKRVLNVGGGAATIPIPPRYAGWDHVRLDIDSSQGPDIVCDARCLDELPGSEFDAVYCSHNLEHYWRHDLPDVLRGFTHVLGDDGFAEIWVPDLVAVFEQVRAHDLDLDDVLYKSPSGPITVNDVIYGWGRQIAESGDDFYAHKNGFTVKSLTRALTTAGFAVVHTTTNVYEIGAFALKRAPTDDQRTLLGLPG